MHKSILLPALFGAAALAGEHKWMGDASTTADAYGSAPTECAAGALKQGMVNSVTVVHVSNEDGSELRYFPEVVEAAPGSIVQFQFHPKNHTITQSSFDEPCKPITEFPGLKSGFVPVTPQDTELKVFNVLVNDTKPIWIYCGQTPHCQRGMSMVINEPKDNPDRTLAKYKEAAALVPLPEGFTPPAAAPTTSAPAADATGDVTATSTGVDQAQAVSGTGSGTPAVYTGAAATLNVAHYASFGGLAVAGLAALL